MTASSNLHSTSSRPSHQPLDWPIGSGKPPSAPAGMKPCHGGHSESSKVLNDHPPIAHSTAGTAHHVTSTSYHVTSASKYHVALPSSGVDTGKILASVYSSHSPSTLTYASPPRPNPQALFGPVSFKQGDMPHASSGVENVYVRPIDAPGIKVSERGTEKGSMLVTFVTSVG